MVATAAVYLFKTIFVLIARVNVSETQTKLRMILLIKIHVQIVCSSFLVYTCKYNSDCHGNGYCKREFHLLVKRVVGVCKCQPNYMNALDCSIFGCKYHLTAPLHCRFLCRFDTSFDMKMTVEKNCHSNHFQIPRAPLELPANRCGQARIG